MKGIDVVAPHILKLEEGEKAEEKRAGEITIADRLENSKVLAGIIVFVFLVTMIYWFGAKGFLAGLDLNSVNYIFIMIGFALYLNPVAWV